MMFSPLEFIRESNHIEGIHREPTGAEIEEYHRFMAQDEMRIAELYQFVSIYQPDARLRSSYGLDVRVGNHFPPGGGPQIVDMLDSIVEMANTGKRKKDLREPFGPYTTHQAYEFLHPFTDGNGRSGRMLWMWMMREAPLGFLHTWYYQSLQFNRRSGS